MSRYISRLLSQKVIEAHSYFPVIVITGPRQSGKTSLCRHLFKKYRYANLEDLTTRAAAVADPTAFIDSLGNEAIIDEVQNVPQLLSMIQVRVDEDRKRRYILSGSSNFALLHSVSQSLAGRSALFTLLPFSLQELSKSRKRATSAELIFQGLYPGVISDGVPTSLFYQNYYNTYIERDLRNLLNLKNILLFDKFVRLLATRVGSEFNASNISREIGVSSVTVSEWMSILTASYITYPLRPYYSNMSKQFTKMPKIYFYDTGLLCFLLGIESAEHLSSNRLKGAIYENFAVGEVIKGRLNMGKEPATYFYREKKGLEVDILTMAADGKELYEVKAGKTYQSDYSDNMKSVAAKLDDVISTIVIYDGKTIPRIALNIREL